MRCHIIHGNITHTLGLGGAVREHKSTGHAIVNIVRGEGLLAIYTG